MADNASTTPNLIDFAATGPIHTTPSHPNFSRILLACLINATYIFEIDRQQAVEPRHSRASAWYVPFHYKLHSLLHSPADGSIFGAVFLYKKFSSLKNFIFSRPKNCPAAVVALRGTVLSAASVISDIRDDFSVILQQIQKVPRVDEALRAAREAVASHGAPLVSVAGHSLGAAVALKIARLLASEGILLDTHLFNPPFFSLISVRDEKLGMFIHRIRATAAGCLGKNSDEFNEGFLKLQKWWPHLYVNMYDPVSCNYVHYFRARDSSTAHNSIVNSILRALGKKPDPYHLVPCANLYINVGGGKEFKEAHGLYQWWSEETQVQIEHHSLNVPEFVDRVSKFTEIADNGEEKMEATTVLPSKEQPSLPCKGSPLLPSKAVFKLIAGW